MTTPKNPDQPNPVPTRTTSRFDALSDEQHEQNKAHLQALHAIHEEIRQLREQIAPKRCDDRCESPQETGMDDSRYESGLTWNEGRDRLN